MSNNFIICFDLSLNSTGYSVFKNKNKLVELGTIDTNHIDELPQKLHYIASVCKKINKRYKPKTIVFERGFSRFNAVTQKLFRVFGVVNYLFHNVEQIYIPSKTVRKLICGHGNIKKDDFFQYIKEEYKNIKFRNNDEGDSFALGLAYISMEKEKNGGKKANRNK